LVCYLSDSLHEVGQAFSCHAPAGATQGHRLWNDVESFASSDEGHGHHLQAQAKKTPITLASQSGKPAAADRDDETYSALQGVDLAGDELLEAQHGGGGRDDRVDDELGPRRVAAFPGDGRREPS